MDLENDAPQLIKYHENIRPAFYHILVVLFDCQKDDRHVGLKDPTSLKVKKQI